MTAVERPSISNHLRVVMDPDLRVLAAALVCGIAFDLALQTGLSGLGGAMLFVIAPIALFLSSRFQSRAARVALAVVPLFGVWFAIRDSEWLLVPNMLCILVLLGAAGSWSRIGSVFQTSFVDLVARAFTLVCHFVHVPSFLTRSVPRPQKTRFQSAGPIFKGLVIAFPLVLVLGSLLVSADTVFASLFDINVDIGGVPAHVFAIVMGAWFSGTALRAASSEYVSPDSKGALGIGFTEALVVMACVVVLFVVFVLTQVVVWFGGADHILNTAGLTYAEHARTGFFQLLAVAAITLTLLTTLRSVAQGSPDRSARVWSGLALSAVLLTLVIVGVALQRLFLYESAYGLTMLRLYAVVFAVWIGFVFAMFAVTLFRSGRSKWFFSALCMSGMAFVFVLNVVNPERLVVERNVDRMAESNVPFDILYVAELSNDGVAAFLPTFDRFTDQQKQSFLDTACLWQADKQSSGLSYNYARNETEPFWLAHC